MDAVERDRTHAGASGMLRFRGRYGARLICQGEWSQEMGKDDRNGAGRSAGCCEKGDAGGIQREKRMKKRPAPKVGNGEQGMEGTGRERNAAGRRAARAMRTCGKGFEE